MKNAQNLQPQKPTYFIVANEHQLEFMNTSRITLLCKSGNISEKQSRFISGSLTSTVRHMVALIGCEFVEDIGIKPYDVYTTSSTGRGGIAWKKVKLSERDDLIGFKSYFLKTQATGKVFKILQY